MRIPYIVSILQKRPYIVSTDIVTSNLDELTTSSSRLGATIRETGVCFLRICESSIQKLGGEVNGKGFPLRQLPKHLKRNPASWIHNTVQDHMPNTLRILNMTFVVRWKKAYLREHYRKLILADRCN